MDAVYSLWVSFIAMDVVYSLWVSFIAMDVVNAAVHDLIFAAGLGTFRSLFWFVLLLDLLLD